MDFRGNHPPFIAQIGYPIHSKAHLSILLMLSCIVCPILAWKLNGDPQLLYQWLQNKSCSSSVALLWILLQLRPFSAYVNVVCLQTFVRNKLKSCWARLLAVGFICNFYFRDFSFPLLNWNTYMLFAGREVRIGKSCARGLEYGPRPQAEGRTQDRGHSFSQ